MPKIDSGELGLSPKGTLLALLDVSVSLDVLDPPRALKRVNLGGGTSRCPSLLNRPAKVLEREAFIVVVF